MCARRLARCGERSPWLLILAALFMAGGVLTIWLGLRMDDAMSLSSIGSGVVIFAIGWSGVGQLFWEHQVWKLKVEIERLSRQGG